MIINKKNIALEKQEVINNAIDFVKSYYTGAEGGHDWWHTYRVWHMAKKINEQEFGDPFIVELGALFHDIADSKFCTDENEAIGLISGILEDHKVQKNDINHIANIVKNVSFSKEFRGKLNFKSVELFVVRDADRLDAMGAIGIARAFNYGGFKNRAIYNPEMQDKLREDDRIIQNDNYGTLHHFYEKLLLLKDLMQTSTGKAYAVKRHRYMVEYLNKFFEEWEGKA